MRNLSPLAKALLASAPLLFAICARGADAPVPIPVLVITTYETGKDRGDTPGELQFWAERQDLGQEIKVPGRRPPAPHERQGPLRDGLGYDLALRDPDHGPRCRTRGSTSPTPISAERDRRADSPG